MVVENCPFLRDPRVRTEAKALHAAGHSVSVICPLDNNRPKRECIDGVTLYKFRPFNSVSGKLGYLFEYVYATLAILVLSLVVLAREGFDVVHVANPPDTLVLTAALYKLIGKRIIYDQHDLSPELYQAKFSPSRQGLFRLLVQLERWSYRVADHVIVTNNSHKNTAIKRGNVSPSKVTIVRNGPDMISVTARQQDALLRGKARIIIVYSGVVGVQDGVDCLCRILFQLCYVLKRKDFCCVVMGDGDALPQVKALAHELGLDNHIWFAGWIDNVDVYGRYLNTADICISPEPTNNYNHGSTLVKIMEYMAAGKPIVSFDLLETRFSAQDAALYVRGNDEREFAVQLARLMDDPALRAEMGRYGENRVLTELAWQYSIPSLLDAYKRCIAPDEDASRAVGKQSPADLDERGQDLRIARTTANTESVYARSRISEP